LAPVTRATAPSILCPFIASSFVGGSPAISFVDVTSSVSAGVRMVGVTNVAGFRWTMRSAECDDERFSFGVVPRSQRRSIVTQAVFKTVRSDGRPR